MAELVVSAASVPVPVACLKGQNLIQLVWLGLERGVDDDMSVDIHRPVLTKVD